MLRGNEREARRGYEVGDDLKSGPRGFCLGDSTGIGHNRIKLGKHLRGDARSGALVSSLVNKVPCGPVVFGIRMEGVDDRVGIQGSKFMRRHHRFLLASENL